MTARKTVERFPPVHGPRRASLGTSFVSRAPCLHALPPLETVLGWQLTPLWQCLALCHCTEPRERAASPLLSRSRVFLSFLRFSPFSSVLPLLSYRWYLFLDSILSRFMVSSCFIYTHTIKCNFSFEYLGSWIVVRYLKIVQILIWLNDITVIQIFNSFTANVKISGRYSLK